MISVLKYSCGAPLHATKWTDKDVIDRLENTIVVVQPQSAASEGGVASVIVACLFLFLVCPKPNPIPLRMFSWACSCLVHRWEAVLDSNCLHRCDGDDIDVVVDVVDDAMPPKYVIVSSIPLLFCNPNLLLQRRRRIHPSSWHVCFFSSSPTK